jgi:hypothetical protein
MSSGHHYFIAQIHFLYIIRSHILSFILRHALYGFIAYVVTETNF